MFHRTITVEPVVFLYVLAIFAEYDVIGDLFYVNKCIDHLKMADINELHICTEDLKHNRSNSIANQISKEANNVQKYYNGILYATSIISSFIAASYADRRTKLLPILVPLIGSAIVQLVILGSLFWKSDQDIPQLLTSNGLIVLFVCSFISGISGGTSTLLSSCFAFVAEKCDMSSRTSRIAIVEACLFGGGFFGFTIAGAILRRYPNSINRYIFNFALFLTLHLLLTIYIILRQQMFNVNTETLNRSTMTFRSLLTSIFNTVTRRRLVNNHRLAIYLMLITFILISFWNVSITTMLFIYTRNLLHWPAWKYSYFSSAKFGLCGIFLLLLPLIQAILDGRLLTSRPILNGSVKDSTIITFGLLSRALTAILIGLASLSSDSNFMIYALIAIIFAEYPIPAIRSMISKIIEPNEKAQMFAIISAIQSVCFFIGGIGFLVWYNTFLELFWMGPGWIFILMGIFQFISMFIFW
ncbi:hypothetical protein NH340_JMT02057 [Sarcoptes scabiei]|nr:hypothetical protein NH340_JMT02057 [Sarcoptes scabiei]